MCKVRLHVFDILFLYHISCKAMLLRCAGLHLILDHILVVETETEFVESLFDLREDYPFHVCQLILSSGKY